MSRSKRFLGGLGFGYLYQVIVLTAAVWLTPFLIRHIGQHDFGLWGVGAQLISYLGLMDLGIVALLPREVAYATGRAIAQSAPADLKRIVGEAARVVLVQTPLVALVAFGLWFFSASSGWAQLRMPLAVIMGVYVLMFPARVLTATLDGLQDLSYYGAIQIFTWTANMTVMVFLVTRGWGLGALAAGWVILQTLPAICAFVRLKYRFPDVLPSTLPHLSPREILQYFRRSIWLSVAQIAQSFLSNTDYLILAYVAGPETAVVYDCTRKLVSALANQPQLMMNIAGPAISELRATGDRTRLLSVSIGLTRLMMTASGLVACLVLAANESFFAIWLRNTKVPFGGLTLTYLLVAAMLLRHLNGTTTATLICFGEERRISLTTLTDGVVTVLSCMIAIHFWGLPGAAIGSLIGVCCVSLPLNLSGLAKEAGVSPMEVPRSLLPWLWRFALGATLGQLVRVSGVMSTVPGFILGCGAVALIYCLLVLPLFFQEPLVQYTRPLLARITARRPAIV
jgi:O-antigen/teichoic acid export membrane protein